MDKSHADVYASQLLRHYHGYPLWKPRSYDSDPQVYQDTGTRLGDVGRITADGHFHFLFNACAPADDPVNERGVPEDFELLGYDITRRVLKDAKFHPRGELICSIGTKRCELAADAIAQIMGTPVEASGGIELKFEDSEGALLNLPEGATRVDVESLDPFRDYARKHCESWYRYAKSRGIEVENGSLYFVTGHDKTSSWENAVFSNASRAVSVALKLTSGIGPGGKLQLSRSSSLTSPVTKDYSDPNCAEMSQTVFIRGFKITLRSIPFRSPKKLIHVSAGSLKGLKPEDVIARGGPITSNRQFLSQSQSSSSSSSSPRNNDDAGRPWSQRLARLTLPGNANQNDSSRQRERVAVYSDSDSPSPSTTGSDDDLEGVNSLRHPSNILNDYLLEQIPDCSAVITHDNDWCELLEECDSGMPLDDELIARAMSKYHIVTKSGCAFFEKRPAAPALPTSNPSKSNLRLRADEQPSKAKSASPKKASRAPKAKGQVRSKSGCYTCRIRRKKCDGRPDELNRCETCVRLRLQCLGFGAKRPDWLRENNNVSEIREKIKNFLASQGMIKGHLGTGPRTAEQQQTLLLAEPSLYSSSSYAGPSSTDSSPSTVYSSSNTILRPSTPPPERCHQPYPNETYPSADFILTSNNSDDLVVPFYKDSSSLYTTYPM